MGNGHNIESLLKFIASVISLYPFVSEDGCTMDGAMAPSTRRPLVLHHLSLRPIAQKFNQQLRLQYIVKGAPVLYLHGRRMIIVFYLFSIAQKSYS